VGKCEHCHGCQQTVDLRQIYCSKKYINKKYIKDNQMTDFRDVYK